MTRYTDVTVKVPADRLAEFYQHLGAWLSPVPPMRVHPTGRYCLGCGEEFVPKRNGTTCSRRCSQRVQKARRRAEGHPRP